MRILSFCFLAGAMLAPLTHADEYTLLWWADGWRARDEAGRKVLAVQTSHYAVAFDVDKPGLLHLGVLHDAAEYVAAASQPNEVVAALPPAKLTLSLESGGKRYLCTSAAQDKTDMANYPVRWIESGRALQRFDLLNLVFTDEEGNVLAVEGRLEVIAWPERLHLLLEVQGDEIDGGIVRMELAQGENPLRAESTVRDGKAQAALAWPAQNIPDASVSVKATDARAEAAALPVTYDSARGWWLVDLPERQWNIQEEPDRLDRYGLELSNNSEQPETFPLLFAFDGSFAGVTGMCPMLRDAAGNPTGIPVQISKNWHRLDDRRFLYEGAWFHGASLVTVAPGETWRGELAITYARWGGVPAASHAQLSLIGWGTNQLWDQAAIGTWGESICYDPDVNLNRSIIDDIRPLMVTGMSGGQWQWTHNVGGGDFLVYFDGEGEKQYLSRMKTARLAQGPNLTDVVYAGVTPDGRISAEMRVSTPRVDDVNRAYHKFRYDVHAATPFTRLAFYQLGADNYNDHQFTGMARGNAEGLVEAWETAQGGKKYLRTDLACEGAAPWFSLHGGTRGEQWKEGAWANRGLVIRSWNARLGGEDVPVPYAAVFGTENGVPSANVELVPPPGLTQLEPGDFVEAEVELLILPQRLEDYYGPNEGLRTSLEAHGGGWEIVHRLAAGNDLRIEMKHGQLLRRLPIEMAVEEDSAELVVHGGVGYVPVTFRGVTRHAGFALWVNGDPLDQAVHGNDFWQVVREEQGTFAWTFNVALEGASTLRFGMAGEVGKP